MTHSIEPFFNAIAIKALRPTQMTLGMREVDRKRAAWRARQANGHHPGSGRFPDDHLIPVVLGPGRKFWLVDHHHLVRALHDEGVEQVLVTVIAKLSHLPKKRFFSFMDSHNWLHPYDREGQPCDWSELPRHVGKMLDDPYRSLAGEVRVAGGYAKTETPYSEFLWADLFRDHFAPHKLDQHFDKSLARALKLARGKAAAYLPGFAGPHGDGD